VTEGEDFVRATLLETASAHERFGSYGSPSVVAAAAAIAQAFENGRKVLAFGNGGSAADAQHFVAELVGRFERERPGLPAVTLNTDTSILTAVANDYGYESVFSRQIAALGTRGDVAIGISTSGRSPNVTEAIRAAREAGLVTIALTGRDGGVLGPLADHHINVAETNTARVQEIHITILHAICALVDRHLAARM
jgi:D-sedoheptulose 7-phosphate isomerase